MQEERSLLADLLRFYGRLILFGAGVSVAVMGLSGLWSLYRGVPLTWERLTTPHFWVAMASFAVVWMSINTLTQRKWQAQALWVRAPLSNDAVMGDEERRIGLAWYAGVTGIICFMTTAVPWLFK